MMTKQDTGNCHPQRQAIRYFMIGQIGFFAALIVCVLLLPQGLRANRGFSYYGDYGRTAVLYHLAFIICGVCSFLASLSLPNVMPFKVIKVAFRLLLVLLLGVAVTTVPHSAPHSEMMDNIHRSLGVVLFVLQFTLGAWLALRVGKDWRNLLLLLLLFAGGLASLLALLAFIHILLEGQVLFQLAFGLLVIRALYKL